MADKKKLQCQIYADFESLWVNKVSKERKPDGSYSDKCQSRVAFSHDYKLFCVNDTLSKLTKKYISDEAIQKFIESKIEEMKYCKRYMNNAFGKELLMKNILMKMLK